jgi:molybdopterin molybdotransferase
VQKRGTNTFREVAMQPGMPQGFGTAGPSGIAVFMLPGTPASASVSLCLFVAPALDALEGLSPEPPATARAILTSPVQSAPGRRSFLTGILAARARTVTRVTGPASHRLTALARANTLIIVPDMWPT